MAFLFFIDNFAYGINLNTGSTEDYYREERDFLVILDVKI